MASFHLSLPVASMEEEIAFFATLRARVSHRDPGGYVNLDWFGAQITLQPGQGAGSCDFHFGMNLDRETFEALARELGQTPKVIDEGTAMERRKLYARSPAGYLVEIKT